ncbi:cytochrome P450 2J2-like [Thamnophis elegans]|uniref:cytochrome P450 2J2-like n=1 Tax=Thamnophis elegans TaxID=35005 RepID=UPI0013785A93|nr:cytochrome P450 2J2-like [Thamnophis elegans]
MLIIRFQFAEKYGPVYSLYLGTKPIVLIHGFPLVKEVLVIKGTEFAGRPVYYIIDLITKTKGIITQSYGEVWKEQKRFSLRLFRNFGVGKNLMEERILEEASYLTQAFTENMSKLSRERVGWLGIVLLYSVIQIQKANAVIHEIQRISSVLPLGLPHKTINDVQLLGYKIPKDTMILVNIQSAHCDESQWKFPNEFNPSNFLNEEGEFVKPEAFLAFSAGPRFCLGEILARMELFLLFTSIVRNFQLSWPDKSQAPDLTPYFAITQSPSRFKVLLKCRQPSG